MFEIDEAETEVPFFEIFVENPFELLLFMLNSSFPLELLLFASGSSGVKTPIKIAAPVDEMFERS